MANGVIVQPSEPATQSAQAAEVPPPPSRADAKLFSGLDPSIHMLGLPKSYPQLGRWVAVAIIAGAIVALSLIAVFVH